MPTENHTDPNILRKFREDIDDELERTIAMAGVPEYMREGLVKYLRYGIKPGHFLLSILENDWIEACAWADENNQENLIAYARALYPMPVMCYGSKEKVAAWIEHGAAARALVPENS